jgi:hypothetical protein
MANDACDSIRESNGKIIDLGKEIHYEKSENLRTVSIKSF